ncbi:MAG: TIGR03862 family flavoprotein [Azospirillaceae bacterium]|nr:TIGR03862 family flavoprotein [Azospirillaceae bacterium]
MRAPDIVIIGGGPAGLMAAECLATAGRRVTIYDGMATVGRKFLMAGRGGLNLTHSQPPSAFVTNYGAAQPWFERYLARFSPDDLRAWAEGLGIATTIGSSGRVFPVPAKASPLLRAWLGRLGRLGVTFRTRHHWQGIDENGANLIVAPDGTLIAVRADATVLALGGASWPRLGSTGSWVEPLRRRGVTVTALEPANCGFETDWSAWFRERNEGRPLKNLGVHFDGRMIRGDLVVTRYGLEGGPIYSHGPALRAAIARGGAAVIHLDLRPQLSVEALTQRLQRPRGAASWSTWIHKTLNLAPPFPALLRDTIVMDVLDDPHGLAATIKALPVALLAPRPLERAISTAGGIAFSALTDDLMLTAIEGCFACGEMLEWEAPTGGYLLQGCFSTGVWAADGVERWLQRQ